MFRNNRRNLSELDFPLLSELRRAFKKDFAKAKLLTGEPCLKVSDNKCNYIKLVNGKYFISMLSYDSFKARFTRIEKEVGYIFNNSYLSKVTKVSDDLYRYATNYYLIVRGNSIACIFHIQSFLWHSDSHLTCTDMGEYYCISFTDYSTEHKILIDKKDLSFNFQM